MLRKIAPALLFLLLAGMASASVTTFSFVANGTSSAGDPIKAEADFTFNNLTLTVTLKNLLPNPGSVAQNLSGFSFAIMNGGQMYNPGCSVNCFSSASATQGVVNVAGGGVPSYVGTPVDPKWAVTLSNGNFKMNGLAGGMTPAYSIIGPAGPGGTYSNANSSIAGNAPHNPFIYTTATWTFSLTSLPANFSIGHIVFSFGTASGDSYSCDASGCSSGGGGGQGTPEPISFVLAGTGLIGIYFIRRRRSSSPAKSTRS